MPTRAYGHRELGLVAHLSAMTVAYGGLSLYAAKSAQLGPDPLREDADKEVRAAVANTGLRLVAHAYICARAPQGLTASGQGQPPAPRPPG